ncbi:prolipoprotein diacylglyceryl transferase [Candidatus Izimaplasma bacterium ZiA1]|uniref:prolipoprotein diacylglyceryl transferase n=1 Tax=Candidatus Izimoplasma sp. ZiA1 TaxID=2024899 RepID=UPI000BAA3CBA|nr:prolipoprotein diacylglyceryl transferase [Candidatus Izimaplasma bacterium ZiA1]
MEHIDNPLSDVFIQFGDFKIFYYSVMILLGIIIAVILGIKEGKKLGISSDLILDGVIIIVPLSIIGARLYYVIFEWDQYSSNLISILDLRSGGLAIHGGIIVAFVSAYIYTRIKKVSILRIIDLMAPGFMIAQASGRWGNFFNQEAHGGVIGGVTNNVPVLSLDAQREFLEKTLHLPKVIANNMYINGPDGFNYYHPTFLYESSWNVVGFIIVLFLRRTKWVRSGDLLGFYFMWYSIGRFFIEGMRTDSLYVGNTGLRTAQIISIVMFIGGLAFIIFNHYFLKTEKYADALEKEKQKINVEA